MTSGNRFEQYRCWKTACVLLVFCAVAATAAQAQVYTKLVDFDGTNGADNGGWSYAYLAQSTDGNLYGTTITGGANNLGTVFKMTPSGTLSTLYSFCNKANCSDGSYPYAAVSLATGGNLYGTTAGGGSNGNYGTVFRINPTGTLTTLYSFCARPNCADGLGPAAALVQSTDGNFFGTTTGGGANGYGTVFKITSHGVLTTLYSFCAQPACTDGVTPVAGLIQASDGNFYGTTAGGGDPGCFRDETTCGTVFKITPGGELTTLHWLELNEGVIPYGGLVQAGNGKLYGMTASAGLLGYGTIFGITPRGILTKLHDFDYAHGEGARPHDGLVLGTDGNLYGTTWDGGNAWGALFKVTLDGAVSTLYRFCGDPPACTDGYSPSDTLTQATKRTFYGVAAGGGIYGAGAVFSLDMGLAPFVKMLRDSGKAGKTGGILGQGFTGTTDVSVDGNPATFTVVSDTYLTATVPAGATTGPITVTTPGGRLTSDKPFRVTPQLFTFDPPSGPIGTQVTISGVSLTQTLQVGFGNRTPAQFTVDADTQVTATVPAGAQTGKVGIQTQGGTAISAAIFTVTP